MNLDGQVAAVIGGTSGLGRAVAMELARLGARVVVGSRDKAKVDAAVRELTPIQGSATGRVVDAGDEQQVDTFFGEIASKYGRLDIMMCTAGQGLIKPTVQVTLDELMRVVHGNIVTTFLTNRAALRTMLPQGSGLIVNMSSRAALGGGTGKSPLAVYAAAKGGVAAFSQKLASEVRPQGIRVLLLSPAPMITPTRLKSTPDFDLKRAMAPESLAGLIAYFALNPDIAMEANLIPVSIKY